MSSYTDTLQVSYHNTASKLLKHDVWVVRKSFRYYIGAENSNQWVDIPMGFLTDGASVPRLFWNLIPPWGKYGQATVVHDYLCEHGQIVQNDKTVQITRKQTDKIFKEAMQVLDVPKWKVWTMTTAVNLYRKATRKVKPVLTCKKAMIEDLIRENAQLGTFELTEGQIEIIKEVEL